MEGIYSPLSYTLFTQDSLNWLEIGFSVNRLVTGLSTPRSHTHMQTGYV